MWLIAKLAWRNLFRNTRRTLIAGTSIGIGLAGLIFVDALTLGMEENIIRTATSSFLGQAQIHARGFRRTREAGKTINGLEAVAATLAADDRVEAFTPRTMTLGMIHSSAGPSSIMLVGVQPESERHLSLVDDTVIEGTFFAEDTARGVVIGRGLAEKLEAGIGDRVVVTMAQPRTGDLAQELYRVSGIFRFGSREMDSGTAFVRIEHAQHMLGLPGAAHEIALSFKDPATALDVTHPFWLQYSAGGNEAMGWPQLVPQLRAVFDMSQWSLTIIGLILFSIVGLGIVNTLFMSIYERLFEFGVLRAIGTRPFDLWRLVLCEAAGLAVLSIALGAALALVVSLIVSRTGLDYRGIEMVGVVVQDLMYPVVTLRQYLFYPFWLLVFTLVIGTYPAVHAARIPPAHALRKTL